jgi:mono/diheme cytochrome c family protein
MRRIFILGLGFVAGLTLMSLAAIYGLSEYALRRSYAARPESGAYTAPASARAEGWRLAKLYGCTSCHGADYRGLEYNDDPALARRWAPNLTLAAARLNDAQLAQAVRQGIGPEDGRPLWDMPSPTFRTISDAELAAVFADLRARPAGGKPTPPDRPSFKARIAIVRGLFISPVTHSADPTRKGVQQAAPVLVETARRLPPVDLGPGLAKGRHIAMVVCSECHGSDLGGDVVEGGVDLMAVGAYDRQAFRVLMRTGVPPGGRDLGLMSQTAREDLKVFSDDEIDALHAYLVARAQRLSR